LAQRFSAIDIGSNAIRMIIGELNSGRLQVLKKFRSPVRLGHDVFTDGEISEKTLKSARETFEEFARLNRRYKVVKCRAVATSAMREAKNRHIFIHRMADASDIQVEVIDGVEEAQLIFSAVNREIALTKKKAVLIDIGGGSVEVTLCQDEKMLSTQSFPLGTVRLLESLKKRDLSESHLNVVIGDFIGPLVRYLEKEASGVTFDFAVGTGGNLEAMARLKVQLLQKTPNTFLSLSELVDITQILREYTVKDRIDKLGLRPDRADVIVPAMMVVKTIIRQARIEKIQIPCVGLRDGLLWSVATK
jgi:exopolyphosphatase/guanosine-5'-triphosphate,3'-diphosphate pyrophosphatase